MYLERGTERRPHAGFKVFLALGERDFSQIGGLRICLHPSFAHWNDFGLKTRFHYKFLSDAGVRIDGVIHFAFLDDDDPTALLKKALVEAESKEVSADNIRPFFSMLPSLQSYRDVVKELGPDEARSFLLSLHDVVAINHFDECPDLLRKSYSGATKVMEKVRSTRAFKLSFMRSSESFYAFNKAGPILDGLTEESIGETSPRLKLRCKLDCCQNYHELDCKFEPRSRLSMRICVVIGKNGVGKSQSLSNLVKAAVNGSKSLIDPDRKDHRPMINRLIALGAPGVAANTFPASRRRAPRIEYRRLSYGRNSRMDRNQGLGDLLV